MEVSLFCLVIATSLTSQTKDDSLSTLHLHVQVALMHLLSVISLIDLVTWVKTLSTEKYLWKVRIFVNYGLEQLHSVLIPKRRKSSHHLVDQAPQTPPININLMPHLLYYFRCQVLRCSTDRGCWLLIAEYFRQTKVSQFDIAHFIDYQILRLQAELSYFYSL